MNRKYIGYLTVMFIACLFFAAQVPAAESIKWYPYHDGMDIGKDKNKKIYINFYSDWCGYCKMMTQNTFKDKKVIDYLNENYVPIRINSEKEPRIASKYSVRGLPANWFISEAGDPIGNQPGYVGPEDMLKLLKFIGTDSYQNMSYSDFKE